MTFASKSGKSSRLVYVLASLPQGHFIAIFCLESGLGRLCLHYAYIL